MLTAMLVQYLVGLCCLRRNPNTVDVVLGDMVLDPAAGKERDVDVTVTLSESPGVVRAFKAYEVKREKTPLDVAGVEQLCIKLLDMPSVTYRAIVSASGFTESAQAKAAHHGVELFAIQPWTRPLEEQFPGFEMQGLPEDCLRLSRTLLFWHQFKVDLLVPSGPKSFTVQATDPIFTADGSPHAVFSSFNALREALLFRSTEILCRIEPALTVLRTFPPHPADEGTLSASRPAWPHTHTLDVGRDEAYLEFEGRLCKLETVTINGYLQWQTTSDQPMYHVLERVPDGQAFAGAMVALGPRDGQMFGFVVSPESRTAGVHLIQLEEKHLNAIRRLRIEIPAAVTAKP